jgi:hypothetical protein
MRRTAFLFLLAGLCMPLGAETAGGVQWTAPAGWKAQPERPMRAATYMVAPASGDKEPGECAVFYFGPGQGGGIDDNIKRWLNQFEPSTAKAGQPKSRTINGLKVTTIDHAGTYKSAGGPMMKVQAVKPGFRLLGAIVEAPQGNVFFKFTAPEKTAAANESAFEKLLQSVKK